MIKIEVKYNFKYSDVWDEDNELSQPRKPLIEGNEDGSYVFNTNLPTKEMINIHCKLVLNQLMEEDKIDYFKIIDIN